RIEGRAANGARQLSSPARTSVGPFRLLDPAIPLSGELTMIRHVCIPLVLATAASLLPTHGWAGTEDSTSATRLQSDDKTASSEKKNADSEDKKTSDQKSSDSKSTDQKKESDKSAESKPEEKEKSAPTAYTVKKGPFKVDLTLDGVFESKRNTE